ncbi:uncharacterized protein AB675_3137 [Cyphellophora attinorum]|uniref:Uncharacterized protein n=1 Tax=Cyphellophora attinorum TaxID=1664694 RepID=A0A0N0NKC1_9EURO|nr:uncharacterized protein AB675_3137 [Phialophora attinorum]KPI37971.1 hypothetical protein AB675_3137 [Phialophora attinorum]
MTEPRADLETTITDTITGNVTITITTTITTNFATATTTTATTITTSARARTLTTAIPDGDQPLNEQEQAGTMLFAPMSTATALHHDRHHSSVRISPFISPTRYDPRSLEEFCLWLGSWSRRVKHPTYCPVKDRLPLRMSD